MTPAKLVDAGASTVDFESHFDRLRNLRNQPEPVLRTLLEARAPIFTARAPGRLDVMGGVADYSGSLVLQLPIAEAAFASIQPAVDGKVMVVSLADSTDARIVQLSQSEWSECLRVDNDEARRLFSRDPETSWAAYALGPILVLLKERNDEWRGGLRIVIDSQVPEGKGVSSSAALEVAVLRAFADLIGCELGGDELARLCQVAENSVVGAPCGIMDQMTAALGRENQLLALRCQPATVEGYIPIPHRVGFWGIDSGIRHSVSGSDYRSVRCGAFMGYRMIADAAGFQARPSQDLHGAVELNDPAWNGYLANISPAEFQARFAETLPERIPGAEFLRRYGGITDRVTRVDPDRTYAVRQPTRHPIEENDRIRRFAELLRSQLTESSFQDMGRLMFESNASYSACGIGSEGTDLLVDLVCETGPASGLYGARITGGGSGGAVAVLGRADADHAVVSVARKYGKRTGRKPYVFRGSSPGACCLSHQLF